jgi:putative membrane protein
MERAADMSKHRAKRLQTKRANIAVGIIVLFHTIGAIGLWLRPVKPLFIEIMPFHLLLMMLILIYTHQGSSKKLAVFTVLIYLTSFIAEFIGVNTGWLFGNYTYVKLLGPRLGSVPLIIGVNWFLLIYATGVTLQRIRIENTLLRLAAGAATLVVLDTFIEPVSKHMDYWRWADGDVPYTNYLCWFVISFILLYVFEKFQFRKQSIVASSLLVCQFLFFTVLQ